MNNEEIDHAALSRDKADVALDVMFAAAGIGMLAAIRQGLDLEGGLAQIIGPPPCLETHAPELPSENGESPTDSWKQ